ncbi:hypothetical protein ABEB36_009815 [Hypothenemus hampei]|uniref:Axin n=1 Tax=Hypothenemus hampei TaxID=57062 RepID=A0ABD1EHS5_HYPHA
MSGKDQEKFNEDTFHHNSPRPPVPGEEQSYFSSEKSTDDARFVKPCSPVPKRHYNRSFNTSTTSSSEVASVSSSRASNRHYDLACNDGNRSPPSCLRWANSLHFLLQDGDGVKLFRRYLESEGKQHSDALDFWFACEGLRKQEGVDKIMQLVKLIYKKYFTKSALPVADEVRKEIGKIVKSSQCLDPPVTLFDKVQAQIEHLIVTTTYPNFLKSEMYLQFVENAQTSTSSSSGGSSSNNDYSNDLSNIASGPDPLPILHEDIELVTNLPLHTGSTSANINTGYHMLNAPPPVRLTKDVLLKSQKLRSVDRSKSETFASMIASRGVNSAHAAYNQYNPVSRQDSELQSLSSHSDARTDPDNISLTDSSIDGRTLCRASRRQAILNKEVNMKQVVIPRTQWIEKSHYQPMDPQEFFSLVKKKLEVVKKERDMQEWFEKKLTESSLNSISEPNIRENLLLEDENDQSILDDHVSLVFPDTPARSSGVTSPQKHRHYQSSRRRKEGAGSVFSTDSGNVHDFKDGSEYNKSAMVKSRSMPEYQDDRFVRGATGRRSASKKTLADLTDSGVSVVSDVPSVSGPFKDNNRVWAWIRSEHHDMSAKQRSNSYRTSSATSPISNRHKKGFGSRSSSIERNTVAAAGLCTSQSSGNEASKLPLVSSSNDTLTQLEEARRRLEDDCRTRSKQRSSSSRYSEMSQSSQSTLRKSQRNTRPTLQGSDEVTTVVFTFCDEQFPYRTKIPGSQITLKQFKDYLPKRGNYRFFFKTLCEDLGNQVIHEEITHDGDVLPLWEGKIMAQVKPIID